MAKKREWAGAKENHQRNPGEVGKGSDPGSSHVPALGDLHERGLGAVKQKTGLESATLAHPGVDIWGFLCFLHSSSRVQKSTNLGPD